MIKPGLMLAAVLLIAGTSTGWAQSVCPLNGTKSDKLACLIPQIYGPYGLGSGNGAPLLVNSHQAHFENDFLTSFTPINTAIGIQASQLPLASPSSGISFLYDPTLKTFVPSELATLGPILGERAETIGRRRVYVAFSYQYFNYDSIDGQDTASIPAVFEHEPEAASGFAPCPDQTNFPAKYQNQPCFVRDFIQTFTNVNLREHQFAFYATYGLTSRLDVSVVVPILKVNLAVTSNATIVSNSVAPAIPTFPGQVFHQFDPSTVASCAGKPQPCLNATFNDASSATGIGDVLIRGKYELYKGEHLGFAVGTDIRTPTGDATNYLGSGAIGVTPFGVVSYRARIAPHLELGYEVNGSSILAGNFVGTTTNTKASLPNRFIYIAGADVGITKRLSGAFDFVGNEIIGGPQLHSSTYTDLGRCVDINCTSVAAGTTHPTIGVSTDTNYNESSASMGLKFRPVRNLIVTGNALVRVNDGGLKSSVVPLVGVSYSF